MKRNILTVEEPSIRSIIMKYYDDECIHPHGRHRSWEYCYDFFDAFLDEAELSSEMAELATLHLSFFLASWGMYRGSAFVLKTTYKFHEGAIAVVRRYASLRGVSLKEAADRVEEIKDLCRDLKSYYLNAYKQFHNNTGKTLPSVDKAAPNFDLLACKVILGTLCCAPAFDIYFCIGLKACVGDIPYSLEKRIDTVFAWISTVNVQDELSGCNAYTISEQRYPDIKLIDMYFWQRGQDIERESTSKAPSKKPRRFSS